MIGIGVAGPVEEKVVQVRLQMMWQRSGPPVTKIIAIPPVATRRSER